MQNQYACKVFSRRLGNMIQLEQYKEYIIQFYNKREEDDYWLGNTGDDVADGIHKDWSGVILAFYSDIPVGFMNFSELKSKKQTFDVGYAYVDEMYRDQNIWIEMSHLAENEAKNMGAKEMRRFISNDVPFLADRLMKEGYRSKDWQNHPLSRRL